MKQKIWRETEEQENEKNGWEKTGEKLTRGIDG